ncbi:MAG: DUF4192 domain-containing protein [Mycobacteriaceae bacterium]
MSTQYWNQQPLRLNSPSELIAAIPAMLGFCPERSLVVISLVGISTKRIQAVLRHDLCCESGEFEVKNTLDFDEINDICDRIARLCVHESSVIAQSCAEVVAVLIDSGDGKKLSEQSQSDLCYAEVAQAFSRTCDKYGVKVIACYYTKQISKGQAWIDLFDGECINGHLPDPQCSAVAAAHVYDGRTIYKNRQELSTLLELKPRPMIDDMATLLLSAEIEAGEFGYMDSGSAAELIIGIISTTALTNHLTDENLCTVAFALRDIRVRDIMFGLALGDKRVQSEQVWIALTRVLPIPDRAEAATLLAYSAYIRGDGVLAGMALEVALLAYPEHRMALMLDVALQQGIAPQRLQGLANVSFDIADRLGVSLPPRLR